MKRLMLVVALVSVSPASAQNLAPNPEFSVDILGWTPEGPGAVSFDGASGNPLPGSLRISDRGDGPRLTEALSQCFSVAEGDVYEVSAMVLAMGDGVCFPSLVLFSEAGCVGERTFGGNLPPNEQGTWHRRGAQLEVFPGVRSARASLGLAQSGEPTECNFDSVVLQGREPVAVATVDEVGSVLLALALALSAARMLRS